jgi:hypothetical protein
MADETTQSQAEGTDTSEAEGDNPLQKALQSERQQRVALAKELADQKKLLKQFEGVDLAKYQELQQAQDAAEQRKLEEQQKWGDLKQQLEQKVKAHSDERDSWKSQYENLTVETAIANAYYKAGGVDAESLELLMPKAKAFVKLGEGNKIGVVDVDGTQKLTDKGNPYSLGDLMGEFASSDTAIGRLFKATGTSGSGATQSNTSRSNSRRVIAKGDIDAFGANLEAIASGSIEVL